MMFSVLPDLRKEEPDIERMISLYSKNLMRLCYMYLKDYQLAEEAVSDTLYKAYKKYNSFRNESSEKTWITRIAINVCKDYMRRPSYKEKANNNYISTYASEDTYGDIYRSVEAIDLLNAVYNLPPESRQVILLYYYQELSIGEIAAILRKKENTISVRLKRAREFLKKSLKEAL